MLYTPLRKLARIAVSDVTNELVTLYDYAVAQQLLQEKFLRGL